ncbi:MAG: thermonuclease family protein [Candidatus Nanoarchaeia archaeon]
MKSKQKDIYILIFLIILLFAINYSFLDKLVVNFLDETQTARVIRVIDGDTIEVELNGNETKVRLLGINTPERGERFYTEAKEFLEEEILNKTVILELGKEKYDRYQRLLSYVYINNRNINKEVVENGFGNYYFPSGKDQQYGDFVNAWNSCISNNRNLCEKSNNKCSDCIELKDLNVKNQEIILFNSCEFECGLKDWQIKDEGRKKFVFPEIVVNSNSNLNIVIGDENNTGNVLYWSGEDYVFTKTGDSLFLRDKKGKLVLWKSY